MPYKKLSANAAITTNDLFIWKAFTQGQKWALSKIFNDHYDPLYYYGLRIIPLEYVVKDLLQDLFLKLWSKRYKLTGVYNVKGYLFKSFRSLIIDYLRTSAKQSTDEQNNTDILDFTVSHEQEIINGEEEAELSVKLQVALNDLPSREKEAIYLRYYQNLEIKEVADIMGLKYQSVRNLIHCALQQLRRVL
jgi:RNA polymerase sigma factor (sigma-70 family)